MGWKHGFRKAGTAKPTYKGVEFDSLYEIHLYKWLEIAVKYGLIEGFYYHPDSVKVIPEYNIEYEEKKQLKTKVKTIHRTKTVFRAVTYTADFLLYGVSECLKPYFEISADGFYWCDCKSTFMDTGESKYFSLLRKVLWYVKQIHLNKVVPVDLFHKTYCPDNVRYGVSGKELKAYKGCPTINNFMKGE